MLVHAIIGSTKGTYSAERITSDAIVSRLSSAATIASKSRKLRASETTCSGFSSRMLLLSSWSSQNRTSSICGASDSSCSIILRSMSLKGTRRMSCLAALRCMCAVFVSKTPSGRWDRCLTEEIFVRFGAHGKDLGPLFVYESQPFNRANEVLIFGFDCILFLAKEISLDRASLA